MLAEMVEMLGQMLAIEMLIIEIECSEQQMLADVAGRCCWPGQMLLADADADRCCWQTMLAWQMLLADVAGRMVQRLISRTPSVEKLK
jgi:hypothetical protein